MHNDLHNFLNGEEEEKLLGIRKSVFSSWFVWTTGKPELINFNSQINFRFFKRGWQFWGSLWDPSESDSLWGPPAGCRGEMTLPRWLCQWLTAKGNTEWQTRSQNPIGSAFSFPECYVLTNLKVLQFINSTLEAKWIKALVAFESQYLENDLLCLNFHCVSTGGNSLLGRVNISSVWKYAPSSPEYVPRSSNVVWQLLLLH